MTTNNLNLENRRRYFWLLLGALALTVGSYFYFVHQTVAMVIDQETIGRQLTSGEAAVARLESSYIVASGGITRELALARGFTDPTFESSFAYLDRRGRLALSPSGNEH